MTVVLDSSAVLALLWQEPGSETVAGQSESACISAVNYSEVVAKLVDRGIVENAARKILTGLVTEVVPHDKSQATIAGFLREVTAKYGLSLGDRACLALARHLEAPVLTADRVWGELDLGIEIEVIR